MANICKKQNKIILNLSKTKYSTFLALAFLSPNSQHHKRDKSHNHNVECSKKVDHNARLVAKLAHNNAECNAENDDA